MKIIKITNCLQCPHCDDFVAHNPDPAKLNSILLCQLKLKDCQILLCSSTDIPNNCPLEETK